MRWLLVAAVFGLAGCDKGGNDTDGTSGTDADGDGYADDADCAPDDAAVHPGAIETCDGVDQDCDTVIDDSPTDGTTFYADADADTFGAVAGGVVACTAPNGTVTDNTDCDDANAAVNPAADEVCDALDNDCDGTIDQDVLTGDGNTYYPDVDADGHGDASQPTLLCGATAGFVLSSDDCDDADATLGAPVVWHADADGDGFGDASDTTTACLAPTGYVADATDCDDTDAALNPGTTWYQDNDLDGYGNDAITTASCDPGPYWTLTPGDCQVTDASIYPGAPELCVLGTAVEGRDNDCDGLVDEECPTVHCGTISIDTTWGNDPYGHLITCDVTVQGSTAPKLVIGDGAVVKFMPATNLYVGNGLQGDLEIRGTSTGVLFTSAAATPRPGDYGGLVIGGLSSARSQIEGLTIEYAGSNAGSPGAITLVGASAGIVDSDIRYSHRNGIETQRSTPAITGTTIELNDLAGVHCSQEPCLDRTAGSFSDDTVTANGAEPIRLFPSDVGALDASSTYVGNVDDIVYIQAGIVVDSTHWQDLDAPYRATGTIFVGDADSPILTLDGGVQIAFERAVGLNIATSSYGDLVVDGSADTVTLTSAVSPPNAGDWVGLVIGAGSSDFTVVNGADVEYAGFGTGSTAGITVSGGNAEILRTTVSDSKLHGILVTNGQAWIHDSLIERNGGDGVHLDTNANLDAPFTDNVITGNDGYAMSLPSTSLGYLDPSSTFVGNVKDFVQVTAGQSVSLSATWSALDVPYYASADVRIESTNAPLVTILDGVEMYFAAGYGVYVGAGSYADLVIDGDRTSGAGVLFASGTGGGPGSWTGLVFGNLTSPRTHLAGFTVDDAGGIQAGITLSQADASFSDCAITDSLRYGVYADESNFDLDACTISGTVTTTPSTLPDGDGLKINSAVNASIGSFSGNTITDNDRYPVYLPANQMVRLDAASTYAGNGSDLVYVSSDTARRSGEWAALDVPWYLGGLVSIEGASAPLITATGATFEFGPGQQLNIGQGTFGDLYADTCTFTSGRTPQFPGDWNGIFFGSRTSLSSGMVGSTISFGGGILQATAANLTLIGGTGTFTGNTITDSPNYGTYVCSFRGTVGSNTYVNDANGDEIYCP
jgi:hypothetical protein